VESIHCQLCVSKHCRLTSAENSVPEKAVSRSGLPHWQPFRSPKLYPDSVDIIRPDNHADENFPGRSAAFNTQTCETVG
jgi:hypothetical protein